MRVSGPSELFRALYDACEGLIELRALERRGSVSARTFVAPSDHPEALHRFLREHEHDNLYFGVATRRDANAGDLLHCLHLPALFVDIDFKAVPMDQARAAVRRLPLRPSIAVRSGGGVHLYWLLREPMGLPAEAARAKDLLRRLAIDVRGDLGSAEPARILRLPGSWNHKYMPPRHVTLTHLDASSRYNPIDFDSLLPAEQHHEGPERRFAAPETIVEGARNSTLYKLGRSLRARGLTEHEILATLVTVNAHRCQPPLEEEDVRAIARWAATQPDGPAFVDRPFLRRKFTVQVWP
jgi:hypothetical protein